MNKQAEALNKALRDGGIDPKVPPPADTDVADGEEKKPDVPWIELPREGRYLEAFAREAGAIVRNNGVYVREKVPVTVRLNPAGAVMESMSAERFRTYLEGQSLPYKMKYRQVEKDAEPVPIKVKCTMNVETARGTLASDQFLLQQRELARVNLVRQPVERADGRIELLPIGYDAPSQTLTMANDVNIREDMTIDEARTFLVDLHKEFPFADRKPDGLSRGLAVHLSAMLGMFGAGLQELTEPRMNFVYDANSPGSGKTLLVKLAVIPVLGACKVQTIPDSVQEFGKILDTAAIGRSPYLFFDEMEGNVRNRQLNAFITSDFYSGRTMHVQQEFAAPKLTVVFMAGNNLTLSPDIARRSLYCPLYVEEADVQSRKIARVLSSKLLSKVSTRADVLSALWAIIRHWDLAGRPQGERLMSGFEAWCGMFGGMLQCAGLGDPLEPAAADESPDNEADDMALLVKALSAELGKPGADNKTEFYHEYAFEELIECCLEHNCFAWIVDGKWKEEKIEGREAKRWYEPTPRCGATLGKIFSRKFGGRLFIVPHKLEDGTSAPRRIRFGHVGKNRQKRYGVKLEDDVATGYLGAKSASGAYQAVISSMPAHDVYIEAFAGSGAVLRAKPACNRSIIVDRDAEVLARFAPWPDGVELVTADAIAYLADFDYGRSASRVLVYCDPPYVLSTRSSSKRYAHEMTDDDHLRLIAVLRSLPCSIIISGYPSALYQELLVDWRCRSYQVMTRGGVRTEMLWMNYERGSALLSRFVGRDFIDRQRIKRKAERWRRRFAAMPADERNVVLASMLDVIG